MHRKASKAVALVAIVAILSLSVPGLFAAEKTRPKFNFRAFIESPYVLFSSLVSFVPLLDSGNHAPNIDKKMNRNIMITGVIDSVRPDGGD